MNTHSRDQYVAMLRRLRDEHRSQLDDGVLSDLDQLIEELGEVPSTGFSKAYSADMAVRVLEVVGAVVALVTNVRDWWK